MISLLNCNYPAQLITDRLIYWLLPVFCTYSGYWLNIDLIECLLWPITKTDLLWGGLIRDHRWGHVSQNKDFWLVRFQIVFLLSVWHVDRRMINKCHKMTFVVKLTFRAMCENVMRGGDYYSLYSCTFTAGMFKCSISISTCKWRCTSSCRPRGVTVSTRMILLSACGALVRCSGCQHAGLRPSHRFTDGQILWKIHRNKSELEEYEDF